MKTFVLLFVLVGFIGLSKAQNNLVIFNQEGNQFFIILNGIKQNAEPKTNVKIKNLTSDSYKLKVIFSDGQTPDLDKSIYFADPNHEYVTEVKKNKKGEYKLRIVSYGPTATNSYQAANTIDYSPTNAVSSNKNTTNTNNNIHSSNLSNENSSTTTTTVTTTESTNNQHQNGSTNENVDMNVNIGGASMNVNVVIEDENDHGDVHSNTNTNTTTTHTTTTTTTNSGNDHHSNTNNNVPANGTNGCYTSNTNIGSVVTAVHMESFDDDKKLVVKQALKNKCISTDQVITILKEFSFDDDKVEIAKYCYTRCSDKNEYYKVNSAFAFSGSKEELNKYIESK